MLPNEMNSTDLTSPIKAVARSMIMKYSNRSNSKAFIQCINTLVPYLLLFYFALVSVKISYWLTALIVSILSLFIVRIFMLMHDCGHQSLFQSQWLNSLFGFLTGVFVGMPQYVWSQHHNYHHSTNGNWEKYRGPLNILSVREYANLSPSKQKFYCNSRNIFLAPFGAFMYFIFNPRFNWALGSLKFLFGTIIRKLKNLRTPLISILATQESRYWKTGKEYWHMTLNNLTLLSLWVLACWYFGTGAFFSVYLISLSLAGAAGIIIFTIQHNFEDSYASDSQHWDYYLAAIKGTSFLRLPKIINWFGADIAYHHIHHISAAIPNYNLAPCHQEYAPLFEEVPRMTLSDIAKSFKFILWDSDAQKIISIAQYDAQRN